MPLPRTLTLISKWCVGGQCFAGHGARGTGHGARGTGHGARGTGHGARGTGHAGWWLCSGTHAIPVGACTRKRLDLPIYSNPLSPAGAGSYIETRDSSLGSRRGAAPTRPRAPIDPREASATAPRSVCDREVASEPPGMGSRRLLGAVGGGVRYMKSPAGAGSYIEIRDS
jgi:hypothetical protein